MANIYDMTDTWNNGATTFTAIKMDVSDSASAANSLLLDLKVDGVTKASIDKAGNLSANLSISSLDNVVIGATTPAAGTFTSITGTSANINGTVTADGLTVDGGSGGVTFNGSSDVVSIVQSFAGSPAYIHLDNTIESGGKLWRVGSTGGVAGVGKNFGILNQTDNTNIVNFASNGDISFYEDTGTTAKFFWDASAESLGIGTSSPSQALQVAGAIVATGSASTFSADGIYLQNKGSSIFDLSAWRSGASVSILTFSTDSGSDAAPVERMRIDSSGNLLIGTSTAGASKLVVNDDSIQVNTAKTPASASDTGTTGEIAWDANYVYVCVATNTWKRSALSTW